MNKISKYKREAIMQIILPIVGSLLLFVGGGVFVITYVKGLLIDEHKRETKEMVQSFYNVIEEYYKNTQDSSISVYEAKKQLKHFIKSARYGSDEKDYYWLINKDGQIIAHPYFSDQESLNNTNKDFSNTLKRLGEFAKENKNGFIEYQWQWKHVKGKIENKMSYVAYFEPWEWTIGTGFYYKEVDQHIAPLIRYVNILIIVISIIISLFYFIIIRRSSHNIKKLLTHEKELSIREKRFRNMAENLDNGLMILENQKVVYSNNQIKELFDIEEDIPELSDLEKLLVPEEKKRYEGIKEKLFNPENPENEFGFWIQTPKKNKKFILVHSTGEYIDNNIHNYLLIYDETKKRLNDSELNKLYAIVKQIPNSIVITDLDGNIEYVNNVFERVTGFSLKEVKGQKTNVLKSDKMPPAVYNDLWKTISSGNVWENDLLNKKKNGELFWERTIIFPVRNETNEIINYCAIKADLTHQHQLEEELIKSKEEAIRGEKVKTAFLKNVSHEVNTPLNAILGFTQVLHSELPESDRDFNLLSIIMKNTKILIKLFRDIMDYTKIESGSIRINKTEIKLNELLNKIVAKHNVKLIAEDNHQIEIKVDIPKQYENAILISDHDRITQIIDELVNNAIKFTEKGTIRIGYIIDYEKIEFFIEDTGVGIPESEKKDIYNAFEHGNKLYVSLHKGTGLGLTLIKELSKFLGAELYFKSQEDVGTTFYLSLPSIDVKNYILDNKTIDEYPFQNLLKGKRAIIAEDNDESFRYIKSILEPDIQEIVRVINGDELMLLIEKQKFNYDFIMINSLPQFDCINNTRIIKNYIDNVIVIAIDKHGEEENNKEKNIFDFRITKPFTKKELYRKLKEFFE